MLPANNAKFKISAEYQGALEQVLHGREPEVSFVNDKVSPEDAKILKLMQLVEENPFHKNAVIPNEEAQASLV